MTDRPIIFSGPMVRALLREAELPRSGKTQTRRILKPQPPTPQQFRGSDFGLSRSVDDGVRMFSLNDYDRLPKHPTKWDLTGSVGVARDAGFPKTYNARFAVGDRCWVRETWAYVGGNDPGLLITRADYPDCVPAGYENIPPVDQVKWRVSIHMPRAASRLTLLVDDVRVQRLQDISNDDAWAEGTQEPTLRKLGGELAQAAWSEREVYRRLWNYLHGADAWDANPWVVALTFRVILANIDSPHARAA